jgi:hypothetical protein
MIPATEGFLDEDFEIEEEASQVHRMDFDEGTVRGFIDELEAMKQAVFRILNTERYAYIIYPWDYGIETIDLYGEPLTYVCPELERRVTEALMEDTRITGVTDFQFDLTNKGTVSVTFTVTTIYGEIQGERTVSI